MKSKHPICSKEEIAEILERLPQYRECLFACGYLFADKANIDTAAYPFYGMWQQHDIRGKCFLVHPSEKLYRLDTPERTFVLIGHAYNPFNSKHEEQSLLEDCNVTPFTPEAMFRAVNEWTGIFAMYVLQEESMLFFSDATSMKSCNYCSKNDQLYISSHAQLLADLLGLSMTKYAAKIRDTKVYNTGMRWMPGTTTAYEGVSRLCPNMFAEAKNGIVSIERFYPVCAHEELTSTQQQEQMADKIGQALQNGMKLCLKKWQRAAISLTGGMDSGAAFASTKSFSDQFRIFSFDCKGSEVRDSNAASEICKTEGLEHRQYHIPADSAEIPDFEDLKKIINHNTSYIKNLAEEEIRKIAYLRELHDFDVEIKSDIAEIGRAFYDRKYGMRLPQKLNERHLSALQTRFLMMPRLLRQTDKAYRKSLRDTALEEAPFNYDHADLVYWEYRIGAATAMTTLSLEMAHELTLPYNNRKLLDMFLCFPHEQRLQDFPQKYIIQTRMPEIVRDEVQVQNAYFGKRRILLEKAYFRFRTGLYRPKRK